MVSQADPPTPDQVTAVQTNLDNMSDLVNFVHQYAIDRINTAYLLETLPQDDQANDWAANLIMGALWGIADIPIPGISLVVGIMTGVFQSMLDAPPPSLQGSFAQVWQRFDAQFLELNASLAAIHDDVSGQWNTSFSGSNGQTYLVSDLVNATMSAQDTTLFVQAAKEWLANFELAVWKATLPKGWAKWSSYQTVRRFPIGTPDADIEAWFKSAAGEGLAYWVQGLADQNGTEATAYWLGNGMGIISRGEAPDAMCSYLFQDDGLGNVVNPSGLALRKQVFDHWGLAAHYAPAPIPPPGSG